MSEIQPQDRLRLLRELLLAEDRREIEGLRAELAQIEKEGKKNLTDLLREQKDAEADKYESYVAALQDGTEGAIERSVRTNKARLAGALFPIMGPAIRSYVSEMFRSLAEDLNNTLQNATSVERIRWRFQARMSGVPFSEYVALKTANFRVEELYLMEKGTGLLIQHMAADADHETLKDPDLMSGMLTAIRSFTRDVFGEDLDGDGETDEDQELDRFSFAGKQVLIEGSPTLVLAAVVRGTAPPPVRERMSSVLEALHQKYTSGEDGAAHVADKLQATDEGERREILDDVLMEASLPKVGTGGGMWRAYLFLIVLVLALAAWIGWRIWDGRRWDEFADDLRAQPGIEVISADGPKVIGLRDPEAIVPLTKAPDRERAELYFAPFHSLHPEFVAKRDAAGQAAIADLKNKAAAAATDVASLSDKSVASQQELEKLRADLAAARSEIEAAGAKRRQQVEDLLTSRFANVEELKWQFDDDGVVVSGGAPEPYYTQILEQLSTIDSLGRIDSSGLVSLSGATLEGLLKGFALTPVIYESGTSKQLAVDATVERMVKMIGQLDEIAVENGNSYQFRIRSHPLIGVNRDANKVIEQQRAEDLRRRLVDSGIAEDRLTFELSGDMEQAGRGVQIVPDKVEP